MTTTAAPEHEAASAQVVTPPRISAPASHRQVVIVRGLLAALAAGAVAGAIALGGGSNDATGPGGRLAVPHFNDPPVVKGAQGGTFNDPQVIKGARGAAVGDAALGGAPVVSRIPDAAPASAKAPIVSRIDSNR